MPWILASDFIVQNNCTSAIEASAVDIPVVTYLNDKDQIKLLSKDKENIPNKLSINIFGKEKFIEKFDHIQSLWNKNDNKLHREKLLKRKLSNYGTTKGAEQIAQKIIEYSGKPNMKGYENIAQDSFIHDIFEIFRNFKLRPKKTSLIMDRNKRQTISYDKIQKDISKLLSIMQTNIKIGIKRVRPNTFYLSLKEHSSEK